MPRLRARGTGLGRLSLPGVRYLHLRGVQHEGRCPLPRMPGSPGGCAAAVCVNPGDGLIAAAGFGISVGHATDAAGATGLTIVRATDAPLRASAFAFGRATATREFALLEPWASND